MTRAERDQWFADHAPDHTCICPYCDFRTAIPAVLEAHHRGSPACERDRLRAENARLKKQTGTLTTLLEQVRNRVSRCFYSPASEAGDAALLQAIDVALCPKADTPSPPATPQFLRCDGCGEVFPAAEIVLRSNVDFCRACEAESRAGMPAAELLADAWGLPPPEGV